MAAINISGSEFVLISGKKLTIFDHSGTECFQFETFKNTVKQDTESTPRNEDLCPVSSKASSTDEDQGHILTHRFSKSGKYFAIADDYKQLVLFQTKPVWKMISIRPVIRRCSSITFTNAGNDVVLSDKSGDVYRFSLTQLTAEGELLLGHLSMVLDIEISSEDQYIMSCDRDEKVRVSCYPNAYNIHTYCLGHTGYVINMEYIADYDVLLSLSGDNTVRSWDYRTGRETHCVDCRELWKNKDGEDEYSARKMVYNGATNTLIVMFERSDFLHTYNLVKTENTIQICNGKICDMTHTVLDICVGLETLYVLQDSKDAMLSAYNLSRLKEAVWEPTPSDVLVQHICQEGSLYEGLVQVDSVFPNLKKTKVDNLKAYNERKQQRIEESKNKKRKGSKTNKNKAQRTSIENTVSSNEVELNS